MNEAISGRSKLAFGVILPVGAFLLFHLLLIGSIRGQGEDVGFAGMALYFRSFIIVSLVFISNGILMGRPWKNKRAVLLMGMLPPIVAATYEFISIYGRR
jgi:hypothetical protein